MASISSWPTVVHEINTRAPNDPAGTDVWLNATPYVSKFSIQRGRADELTAIGPGTMSWELRGTAGELDPSNASSPFYPYLTAWRQVRTRAQWAPTGNLLDANTASVETDASGWTVNSNCTLARSTAQHLDGAASLAMTAVAGGNMAANSTPVLVRPNTIYTGMVSIKPATTGHTFIVYLFWLDSNGNTLSTNSSGGISETAGWVQGTFQATSPSNAVQALVAVQVVGVSGGEVHYVDQAGIYAGTISTWAAGSGVITSLFTGYNADGWTTAFAARGKREFGKAQFVDALGVLERISLLDVTMSEMLADGPLALYPLDEAGGTQAGNRSAFKLPNTSVNPGATSTLAGSGPFAASTITSTAALGGAGIVPTASSTALALTTVGTATSPVAPWGYVGPTLVLPSSATPTSGGGTWETWIKLNALPTNGSVIFISQTNAAVSEGIEVIATTTGLTFDIVSVGSGASITTSTTRIDDGRFHEVIATLSADGKTLTVYVDGVSQGTAVVGSALTQANFVAPAFGYTSRKVSAGGGGIDTASSMSLAYVATYSTPLSGARALAHYTAGLNAFYGDTPATRIARILSYPKWLTGLQNLDTTSPGELNTPLLGATGLEGVTVAAELLHIADSTMSDVDIDGQGRVRYRSRDYRLVQTTPAVTFGPNAGAGEVPYSDPAPEVGKNPKYIYPQVQVQQRNGLTALGSDATAVLNNFEQMLTKSDVILADPSMILDLRDDLLRRFKDGHDRATPVTLNPAANPTIWPQVLGLDTAQRCRVNLAPKTAPAKTVDGYVEAFTHTVDFSSSPPWVTSVTSSAAPPFIPWILGDSTYSVIGTTTTPTE